MLLDVQVEWYFCTLSVLVQHVGTGWAVIMRANEEDSSDISWYVVPYGDGESDEMEDLSVVESNPDRLLIKYKDGIIFTYPTRSPRSMWMSIKLKDQPELAGRII